MDQEAAALAPAEDFASTDETVILPNPISTEGSTADAAAEAEEDAKALAAERALKARPKPTMREALEMAAKKVDKAEAAASDKPATSVKDAAEAEDAEAEKKAKTERDETGKFKAKPDTPEEAAAKAEKAEADAKEKAKTDAAAKAAPQRQAANVNEPPARFSADAKAVWATAPEPIRHEVHRAIRNLEQGIEQHAQRWAPLKPFDDLAKQHNTTIHAALDEYVKVDQLLGQDFTAGIERICANKGINLRDFAASVLGQPADKVTSQSDTIIRELRNKVEQLEGAVNGISASAKQAKMTGINQSIDEFRATHPAFDELGEEIAGYIADEGLSLEEAHDRALEEAQSRAARLGFIAQAKSPALVADDPEAQTLKGRKSIKGAPSAGSSPAAPKPAPNIREALRRAAVRAG